MRIHEEASRFWNMEVLIYLRIFPSSRKAAEAVNTSLLITAALIEAKIWLLIIYAVIVYLTESY